MERKSYTRVTLALDIIKKIENGPYKGYHELGIVKHQIDLHDIISVTDSDRISLNCNVSSVPCTPDNLCWKAALLLKQQFKIDKNIHIDIYKNIPVMGGLAGGSANAATMIMLLNEFWELGMSHSEMIGIGKELGMDVPFYFIGQTAFDSEATSVLFPVSTETEFTFILAVPEFGVSTKVAYSGIGYSHIGADTDSTQKMIAALKNGDRNTVVACMHNDFEHSVFDAFPRLNEIKTELKSAGCENAMLSGSGSTLIGIVPQDEDPKNIISKISCPALIARSLRFAED